MHKHVLTRAMWKAEERKRSRGRENTPCGPQKRGERGEKGHEFLLWRRWNKEEGGRKKANEERRVRNPAFGVKEKERLAAVTRVAGKQNPLEGEKERGRNVDSSGEWAVCR